MCLTNTTEKRQLEDVNLAGISTSVHEEEETKDSEIERIRKEFTLAILY